MSSHYDTVNRSAPATSQVPRETRTSSRVVPQPTPPRHPQRQAQATQAVRSASNDYDPDLLWPVRFVEPPGLHPHEREQLQSELRCLRREAAVIEHGIAHIEKQLAA